jgi:hypothetical protein
MRHFKKAVVISAISIFLLAGAIPAFSTDWSTPTPTPTPTPKTPKGDNSNINQRFIPETPQQRINKENEDALRYQQQVPPPGGFKEKPAKPVAP